IGTRCQCRAIEWISSHSKVMYVMASERSELSRRITRLRGHHSSACEERRHRRAESVTDPHQRTDGSKGSSMRLRKMATAMAAVGSILAVWACSGGGDGGGGEEDSFKIGISQLVQHPALDAASDGFKKSFEDAGVEVEWDEQNAQGEQANATSIAQTFANGDFDLVLAVATPAAQAAAQA